MHAFNSITKYQIYTLLEAGFFKNGYSREIGRQWATISRGIRRRRGQGDFILSGMSKPGPIGFNICWS
jgi:IS30 family transposase